MFSFFFKRGAESSRADESAAPTSHLSPTLPLRKQLRFQLPLAGVLVLLAPLLFWSIANVYFARRAMIVLHHRSMTTEAQVIADRISEHVEELQRELATLWAGIEHPQAATDQEKLNTLLPFHPEINSIALLSEDGAVLSVQAQTGRHSVFIDDPLAIEPEQIKTGGVYLHQDGAAPECRCLIVISGTERGVEKDFRLAADVILDNVVDVKLLAPQDPTVYAYVVDERGMLLQKSADVGPPVGTLLDAVQEVQGYLAGRVEAHEPPFSPYTGLGGEEVSGAHAEVAGVGWGVIVESPVENILRQMRPVIQSLFLSVALTAVLGFVLAWSVTARLVQPLSNLTAVARRLAAGDLETRATQIPGNEIGVLGATLNQMAANIQAGQASLAESEARYRSLTENLPDIVFRFRLQPTPGFEYISPAVETITGYAPEVYYNTPDMGLQLIHPDDFEKLAALIQDPLQMTEPFILRWLRKDGSEIWTEQHVTVHMERDQVVSVEGVARDITSRVQDEARIRRANAFMAALNQVVSRMLRAETPDRVLDILSQELSALQISCFVLLFDEPQPFQQVAEAKAPPLRLVRMSLPDEVRALVSFLPAGELSSIVVPVIADELLHRFFLRRQPRYDLDATEQAASVVDPALRPEIARVLQEMRARFQMHVISMPLEVEDRVYGLFALWGTDLQEDDLPTATVFGGQVAIALEQARLHLETKRQAQQIELLTNSAPQGLLLLDPDLRVLLANPAATQDLAVLTDWEPGAVVGRRLTQLGGVPMSTLLQPPEDGEAHQIVVNGGGAHIFEFSAHPVSINAPGSVEGWVAVLQDVTEARRRAQYLRTQERLATVGQLAAGIAHDFNNIMAVIVLYSQMLRADPNLPKRLTYLATIHDQARHAVRLIEQLLDFSRSGVMERTRVELLPFLKELVKLWQRTLPENIEVRLEASDAPVTVEADVTRLQEALMNLAVNARDAMPQGGSLTLELAAITLHPGDPELLPDMLPGSWARLRVIDTGQGMDPSVLSRAFDPFFTTKEPGKGTGLGLSQVYGIVKQHGGEITATSQVGRGSVFTIYLPVAEAQGHEPGRLGREPADAPVPGRGETILVVEDNPDARCAFVDMLTSLGYRVLEAGNGEEALEVYAAHKDQIALVLSDMVMPRMGGLDLFRALRQRRSDVKLVIISGYPLGASDENVLEEAIAGWIAKPLDMVTLSRRVRAILDEEPTHGPTIPSR